MCLVELERPQNQSRRVPVMPGMKIKMWMALLKKAREGVVEFLLASLLLSLICRILGAVE